MNLSQYLGKRIRVTDAEGDVTEGKCVAFTPAADNDPEVDAIDLETDPGAGFTIGFDQNEIKQIEVIE